mgnify:CR=1 FL=1
MLPLFYLLEQKRSRVSITPYDENGVPHLCLDEEKVCRMRTKLIHSQISHAPENADMLYLENFIGNRITNLNGAKPGKWRAMIRTERRIWASDSASLHLCVASQMAMTSIQLTILPR